MGVPELSVTAIILVIIVFLLVLVLYFLAPTSSSDSAKDIVVNGIQWSSNGVPNNSYSVKTPTGDTVYTDTSYLQLDPSQYIGGTDYNFIVTDVVGNTQTIIYSAPVTVPQISVTRQDNPLLTFSSNGSQVSKYLLDVKNLSGFPIEIPATTTSYTLDGSLLSPGATIVIDLTAVGVNGTEATTEINYLVDYPKPNMPIFDAVNFISENSNAVGVKIDYHVPGSILDSTFSLSSNAGSTSPITSSGNQGSVIFHDVAPGGAFVSGTSRSAYKTSDSAYSAVFNVPGTPLPPTLSNCVVVGNSAIISFLISTLDPEYANIKEIDVIATNTTTGVSVTNSYTGANLININSARFDNLDSGNWQFIARSYGYRTSADSNIVTATI